MFIRNKDFSVRKDEKNGETVCEKKDKAETANNGGSRGTLDNNESLLRSQFYPICILSPIGASDNPSSDKGLEAADSRPRLPGGN